MHRLTARFAMHLGPRQKLLVLCARAGVALDGEERAGDMRALANTHMKRNRSPSLRFSLSGISESRGSRAHLFEEVRA
eukprot:498971-Pleurochrysis_carterae.AAC.1